MADIKAVKTQKDSAREIPGRSGNTSPYFELDASIAVADIIQQKGGGTCSPEQLATWLKYKSIGSGTYLTRVSAANKHFGLIESVGDSFVLTERAKKILAPVMPEDATNAKIDAFLNVPLFAKVYEHFRGSPLPPEVGLKNLFLNTYRVLPDRVAKAVRIFLNSAEQAGFFLATGDRSRMVKPTITIVTPPAASSSVANDEASVIQEKPKGGGGGDGTGGVHSAIIGLLRELPQPGPWEQQQKQRFLDAFKATIDFIYPVA